MNSNNLKNIETLASTIEKQPNAGVLSDEGFCMRTVRHDCGSPSCIKGWSDSLFGIEVHRALGINYDETELVAPENPNADFLEMDSNNPRFISAKRAAKVLRHLAITGRVDWSIK